MPGPPPPTPARFRHGAGRLSLDFIRTLRYRGTPAAVEELPELSALAAWAAQCGPVAPVSVSVSAPTTGTDRDDPPGAATGDEAGDDAARDDAARDDAARDDRAREAATRDDTARDQVAAAQALREAVHALLAAARSAGGVSSCPEPTRELINQAAVGPMPHPRLDPAGVLHWDAADPVAATLTLVARDALELAASADLIARIRPCANPDCGALFLDLSRPGARRWCSMGTCGNQAKKQNLRGRRPAGTDRL
jgi:predicted RNA-binding Zn ribbon-like protein